jgi:hypothetical protein
LVIPETSSAVLGQQQEPLQQPPQPKTYDFAIRYIEDKQITSACLLINAASRDTICVQYFTS